ncbi:hypothetical protein [Streptomyces sp. TLI_171]|uniref:hypothetical protein n=1 Tax=Streptomyces sp. TLI_171 TaxID=1938859 RepID=UPI000C5421C1|nr:hypothetical protein [Streptomyces sp. TLI_171]RKE22262.1 hypothetical protein BX266_5701 [Streptomyces sp. TLI_171]
MDDPTRSLLAAWQRFDGPLHLRAGFDRAAFDALADALQRCAAAWAERDAIPRAAVNVLVDVFAATEANAHCYQGAEAEQVQEAAYLLHELVAGCVELRPTGGVSGSSPGRGR